MGASQSSDSELLSQYDAYVSGILNREQMSSLFIESHANIFTKSGILLNWISRGDSEREWITAHLLPKWNEYPRVRKLWQRSEEAIHNIPDISDMPPDAPPFTALESKGEVVGIVDTNSGQVFKVTPQTLNQAASAVQTEITNQAVQAGIPASDIPDAPPLIDLPEEDVITASKKQLAALKNAPLARPLQQRAFVAAETKRAAIALEKDPQAHLRAIQKGMKLKTVQRCAEGQYFDASSNQCVSRPVVSESNPLLAQIKKGKKLKGLVTCSKGEEYDPKTRSCQLRKAATASASSHAPSLAAALANIRKRVMVEEDQESEKGSDDWE